MTWLDEAPTKEAKIALMVALRDITEGKIFVEAERAKLTRLLATVRTRHYPKLNVLACVSFVGFHFPPCRLVATAPGLQ